MIKIKTIDNGWIIEYPSDVDEGTMTLSYNYDDDCDKEEYEKQKAEALVKLLYEVLGALGVYYSKHKMYNIKIEVEKNDEND